MEEDEVAVGQVEVVVVGEEEEVVDGEEVVVDGEEEVVGEEVAGLVVRRDQENGKMTSQIRSRWMECLAH